MSVKTDNFIKKIGPLAQLDMQKKGVLASLTIAQAILESGWGESELTLKANNLFGIKATASWRGATYAIKTREYVNNDPYTITADFKAYHSWEESISDHSELLQNARYSKVLNTSDYKVACEEVYKAGYATDPNYPTKLITLIEQYNLQQYDSSTNQEPKSETGLTLYYQVIVGSYLGRNKANEIKTKLESQGYTGVWIDVVEVNDQTYYRVICGSYQERTNAEQIKAKLDKLYSGVWINIK